MRNFSFGQGHCSSGSQRCSFGKEGPDRENETEYLEDHPMTCKWLITMVSKSAEWGCSPSKWPKQLIIGGVTNYLQVLG